MPTIKNPVLGTLEEMKTALSEIMADKRYTPRVDAGHVEGAKMALDLMFDGTPYIREHALALSAWKLAQHECDSGHDRGMLSLEIKSIARTTEAASLMLDSKHPVVYTEEQITRADLAAQTVFSTMFPPRRAAVA